MEMRKTTVIQRIHLWSPEAFVIWVKEASSDDSIHPSTIWLSHRRPVPCMGMSLHASNTLLSKDKLGVTNVTTHNSARPIVRKGHTINGYPIHKGNNNLIDRMASIEAIHINRI